MSSILRWLACAALALFATAAVADGKAFTLPQKAKVEMADQRALIHFDGKQETLVIDTQIKPVDAAAGAAAGKQSYAWVVPLPNVPTKVEAGTVGMFDTLRELTRPELVNRTKAAGWGMAGLYLALVVAGFIGWPKRMLVAVGLTVGITGFLMVSIEWAGKGYYGQNGSYPPIQVFLGVMTGMFFALLGLATWQKRLSMVIGSLAMTVELFFGLFVVIEAGGEHSGDWRAMAILSCAAGLLGMVTFLARCWREAIVAVGLLAPIVLVPVLGTAGSQLKATAAVGSAITLYQNETIGSYDTAVLSSKDGAALTEWLDKNGYPMPADTAPMVAQLAKEGWCFVAMKLHESPTGFAHPHPMGFVFPASKAIYPMRLTGVGQVAPLTVELFVCGDQQAQVQGFHAGCAVGTKEMDRGGSAYDTGYWVRGADPVPVAHPGLRHFAANAQVLTWLRGVVPANDMGHDIEIGWHPLAPHRDAFYSDKVAREFGVAVGLAVLGVTAIAMAILARLKRKRAAWIMAATGVGLAAMLGVGVYSATPTVAADKEGFGGAHPWRSSMRLRIIIMGIPYGLNDAKAKLPSGAPADAAWARGTIAKYQDEEEAKSGYLKDDSWRNYFHEGDSPNQFSIREENGSAKVYFYNGVGQEFQIWPEPAAAK